MPLDTNKETRSRAVYPTARDDAYVLLLYSHNLLDTAQLFVGTEQFGKNYTAHQQRLGKLATTPDKRGRIYIEVVEVPSIRVSQANLYRLTAAGYERAAEILKRTRHAWRKGDPFLHRYGTGSLTFAIAVGCAKRANLHYISLDDHLHDPRCPRERIDNRKDVNPLAIQTSEGDLVADDLVGIRYVAEEKALFIAPEVDRRTETTNPRIHPDSIIAKKFRQHVEIIRERKYRTHLGVPNWMPLFWTISEAHKDYLKAHVKENVRDPAIARSFLFGFSAHFGSDWHTTPVGYETVSRPGKKQFLIPKEVFLKDVLATPLETIDGEYDLTFPH